MAIADPGVRVQHRLRRNAVGTADAKETFAWLHIVVVAAVTAAAAVGMRAIGLARLCVTNLLVDEVRYFDLPGLYGMWTV